MNFGLFFIFIFILFFCQSEVLSTFRLLQSSVLYSLLARPLAGALQNTVRVLTGHFASQTSHLVSDNNGEFSALGCRWWGIV